MENGQIILGVVGLILILIIVFKFTKKKPEKFFAIKKITDSLDGKITNEHYEIQGRDEKFSTQTKAEDFARGLK